jgi:hypothetical protein
MSDSSGFGAGTRIRTGDLLITNQLLYRLSYASNNTDFPNVIRRPFYAINFLIATQIARVYLLFFVSRDKPCSTREGMYLKVGGRCGSKVSASPPVMIKVGCR